MERKELLSEIDNKIKQNQNGEITAEILNDILQSILLYLDYKIGDLDYLNQPLENAGDLVEATNTLQTQIESNKIGIHIGQNNPNQQPPESYATLDYYLQTDQNGNGLSLWQYTEHEWCKIDNYINDNDSDSLLYTWSSSKIRSELMPLQKQINHLQLLINNLQNSKGDR